MAAAMRWASLGPPQCARMAPGSLVSKCHSFHGGCLGRKKCFWTSRNLSRQRGSMGRVGAFDDSGSELVMNGSANVNEIGTLALVFSDAQEDDGSVGSGQERTFDLPSEDDESNELYDKLAVNSMTDDSIIDGAENEIDSEDESVSEQAHVEVWKEQVETRIGASAFQQASQLLEAVTQTLNGLEDGLVKHAEELEASVLSEDYAFSGNVAEGLEQTSDDSSSQPLEMKQMQEEVAVRDSLLEMLRQEAIEASQTLKTATQAMTAAKGKITSLQEQLDTTAGFLQQEKEATQRALDLFSSSLLALSDAEARVRELEKQVEIVMQGSQVQEYSTEVDSLKVLLDTKEKTIQTMRDENRHNTNMLLAAAKTKEGLANAEKKVQLLTAQVATLEEEVSSRDLLLKEVKNEMVRSTDALKLASRIKQDLNASKQKELETIQDLETQKQLVKELQQELAENERAVHAEQALHQMEKVSKDLKLEVEMLRDGVGARDDALSLMREELDRSVVVLANAAENREAVRQLTSYVEELRADLAKKDETIVSLRKELSQAKLSLQQDRLEPNSIPSVMASTDPAQPTKSTKAPTAEETPLKGKPNWRKQGSSPRRPSQSQK